MRWFVPFGIAYHSCMMIVLSNNINTRETAHAIRKLPLAKAKRYPEDMSSPCHIELSLSEKEEPLEKEPEAQIAANKPKKA
ncbi:unnamed protein product [Musa acuminata subsp. malaccensis]|uniref:(wild Malaysian banana) hypothetical protein n=1 Tax=Musa acuminata subsp. malaccensis TaxID=214687 RepID=A0A804IR74_MUSAM|nr:unnamed protein product [Musa acuminata subsp. malaccensis]